MLNSKGGDKRRLLIRNQHKPKILGHRRQKVILNMAGMHGPLQCGTAMPRPSGGHPFDLCRLLSSSLNRGKPLVVGMGFVNRGRTMRLGIFIPTLHRDYDRVQSAIWIRALQMVGPLRELGCDVSINNPFKHYDVALYHRGMRRRSVYFVRFLRSIASRVYWDTCVDYFYPHEASSLLQVECARTIARLVDGVCVPSQGIAESAKRFSENVFVMPDPINLEHFQAKKEAVNFDTPVFGWSGVACKAYFLAPYADFLDGRTVVISESAPKLPFRYEFVRWQHDSFPQKLLGCDVAFLPRTLESSYTSNNSSFKALVYAVLGIPVIATRLSSYELMARDYDAVAFLEDYGDDPARALDRLRTRDRNPSRVRAAYDRDAQARRLIAWLAK